MDAVGVGASLGIAVLLIRRRWPSIAGALVLITCAVLLRRRRRLQDGGQKNVGSMLLFARASPGSRLTRSALPNLPGLVQAQCPSLASPDAFRSSPVLKTGHLQTLYSALCDTSAIDRVPFYRRLLITPDGGLIALDIAFPRKDCGTPAGTVADEEDETPTLIITHGLTGGSSESYVRAVIQPLCAPISQGGKGYRAIVVNSRGCASTPATSPQLYSASKTADVRCALLWATKTYPKSPLIGIGFSLGANFIAKTVAEDGDETPLVSVIPIATPWDLLRGSEALEGDGPGGSSLSSTYSRVMAGNLRRVIGSHAAVLALHTPLKPHLAILFKQAKSMTEYWQHCKEHQQADQGEWTLPAATPESSHRVRPNTLRYVDDTIVRLGGGHSAPYGEFPLRSAKAYYLQGGAGQTRLLQNVRIPMLALNADDDPIVPLPVLAGVFEILGEEAREVYNRFASRLRLPRHASTHFPFHHPSSSKDEAQEEREALKKWEEQSHLSPSSPSEGGALSPNENVVLALTRGGGHLGWWTSIFQGKGPRSTRWLAQPVGEWVDMIARRVERAREAVRAEEEALKAAAADEGLRGWAGAASLASEEEKREREWAMRSFSRSLWRLDAQAQTDYATSAGNNSGGAGEKTSTGRRIREVQVQVELVDEALLPTYDFERCDFVPRSTFPSSSSSSPASSSSSKSKHAPPMPPSPLRSKVPFLLTKVLEHAPLVHPKDASIGYHADPSRRTRLYKEGEWPTGRVLSLTMYVDTAHPEVGFAELPPDADTGVAGVGTTFDGGADVPGQSAEAVEWTRRWGAGAGGKGRKRPWFSYKGRAGVVRGL